MKLIETVKQTKPLETVSKKYHFFRTKDVIDTALSAGWQIDIQTEATLRKSSVYKQGKQKHMVILSHPDYVSKEGRVNLVIRNSHDGKNALHVFAGFMRVHCSNQLFVKNLGEGLSLSIKHFTTFEEVQEQFLDFVHNQIPQVMGLVSGMQKKELTQKQIRKLAKKALEIRYANTPSLHMLDIDPKLLTTVQRPEDEGNSLWHVLNRIQENIVKGGVRYQLENQKGNLVDRKLRKITGMQKTVEVNTKLFDAALALL